MLAGDFAVAAVERRRVKRNPPAPFTTSTLQQEASRKLGFGAQQTMRCAQQLYEGVDIGGETVGLITYMRTDGVQMAREAIHAIRDHVRDAYGSDYVPATAREYTSKAKNAQEAHEAVRPTDVARTPEAVARYLEPEQRRLYDLVWKRAVASQMQSAELDQVAVDIADPSQASGPRLRANGSVIAFDGFLKLYREGRDDAPEEDDDRMLPPMAERDPLRRGEVSADQHFTQPPPRFSEASLVKRMEELGIGRPSTYASILKVLSERGYARLENRRFIPEDRGRLVTAFLVSFFERYVDVNFTAGLEEQLDDISGGRADWREVMRAFWKDFSDAVSQTRDLKISDVIDALDQDLGAHFFPERADGGDPRLCPACHAGRLGLKLGRHGSFIGCSNYPECQYTRRLAVESGEGDAETLREGMRTLGRHPETGEDITVRRGPVRPVCAAGRAGEGLQGPAAPHLAAEGDGGRHDHAGAGAGAAQPAAPGRHPPRGEGAHRGRARALRAVREDGRRVRLARPRGRRAGGRHEPRGGAAGQEARQRAGTRAAPAGCGARAGAQGAVRAVCPARQHGRQPAARRDDGRHHARCRRGAAGRARQGDQGEGQAGQGPREGQAAVGKAREGRPDRRSRRSRLAGEAGRPGKAQGQEEAEGQEAASREEARRRSRRPTWRLGSTVTARGYAEPHCSL